MSSYTIPTIMNLGSQGKEINWKHSQLLICYKHLHFKTRIQSFGMNMIKNILFFFHCLLEMSCHVGGWCKNTVGRALVLHMAHLAFNPQHPYSPPNSSTTDSYAQIQEWSISIARCKSKQEKKCHGYLVMLSVGPISFNILKLSRLLF